MLIQDTIRVSALPAANSLVITEVRADPMVKARLACLQFTPAQHHGHPEAKENDRKRKAATLIQADR